MKIPLSVFRAALSALILSCVTGLTGCSPGSRSAFPAASSAVSSRGKGPDVYSRAADLYTRGQLNETGLLLEDLCSDYPDFTAAKLLLGRVKFYSGHFPEAAGLLEQALEEEVNISGSALLVRSLLYELRLEEAEETVDRALEYGPEVPELIYLKALCRLETGKTEEALALLRSAELLMRRQLEIPLELAALYGRYGLYDEASGILERYRGMAGGTPLEESLALLQRKVNEKKARPP
ncbi:MAG: CDC27 family protein [Spirochaetales bacterium]|nr:CDC27 family protein [Spirochaetales bacterium]